MAPRTSIALLRENQHAKKVHETAARWQEPQPKSATSPGGSTISRGRTRMALSGEHKLQFPEVPSKPLRTTGFRDHRKDPKSGRNFEPFQGNSEHWTGRCTTQRFLHVCSTQSASKKTNLQRMWSKRPQRLCESAYPGPQTRFLRVGMSTLLLTEDAEPQASYSDRDLRSCR